MRWVSGAYDAAAPSVNELPLDSRNPRYRRWRDQWMEDVTWLMLERGNVLPRRLAHASARALLTFPTERRRDEGNYRSHLEKWLGDVLQQTGRLPDDTPEYYRFGGVAFARGVRASTTLIIDYTEATDAA